MTDSDLLKNTACKEPVLHTMHLDAEPYRKIICGTKTIEMRLYDERRRQIKIGDIIVFESEAGTARVGVKAMYVFSNFAELYANLDLTKCGYSQSELTSASPEDMLVYYSHEKQQKWGVVGIEIRLIGFEKTA